MNFYADQNTTDDMDTTTNIQKVMSQKTQEDRGPAAEKECAHGAQKRRLRRGRAIAVTAVANAMARNLPRT